MCEFKKVKIKNSLLKKVTTTLSKENEDLQKENEDLKHKIIVLEENAKEKSSSKNFLKKK